MAVKKKAGCTARFGALVLVFILASAESASGQRESYRDGLNALEDGRYPDAETHFTQAIQEGSEEKAGGLRRAYLPYYYLGVALAQQGRCREALTAWEESERQGQISKVQKEGGELRGRKEQCSKAVKAFDEARSQAQQAIAQARKAEQTVQGLADTQELKAVWSSGDPSFAARQVAARRDLEQAATRLQSASAGHDAAPLRDARSRADLAGEAFDEITIDAQARLAEIRDTTSSVRERFETGKNRAREELEKIGYLKPFPSELKSRADALTQLLQAAEQRAREANPEELIEILEELSTASERLRNAARPPSRTLRNAVEAFLDGRHEEVLSSLQSLRSRDPRTLAFSCLLRSASRHALFILTGESDAEMAGALYQDATDCQKLKPPAEVPLRYFSPRFLSYYENPFELEVKAAVAEEAEKNAPEEEVSEPSTPGPAESEVSSESTSR